MKTLDEVIDAMERCSIPHCFDCKGCPYEDDDAEVGCRSDDRETDALHYLKVLQKMQKAQPVTKGEWDELYNNPLTWDELRQMKGKPVWMEDDTGTKFYRGWAIVLGFIYDGRYLHYVCDDYSETCVDIDDIGVTWRAYRKERE